MLLPLFVCLFFKPVSSSDVANPEKQFEVQKGTLLIAELGTF